MKQQKKSLELIHPAGILKSTNGVGSTPVKGFWSVIPRNRALDQLRKT